MLNLQAGLVDLIRRTGTILGRDDGSTGARVHASVARHVVGQLRREGVSVAYLEASTSASAPTSTAPRSR